MWPIWFQLELVPYLGPHDVLQLSWVKRNMIHTRCWELRISIDFPSDSSLLQVPCGDHPDTSKTRYWMLRPVYYLCRMSATVYTPQYCNMWAIYSGRIELIQPISVEDGELCSSLLVATLSGSWKCLEHLLQLYPMVNPLYNSCYGSCAGIIRNCFASGMNIDVFLQDWENRWMTEWGRPSSVYQIRLESELEGVLRRGSLRADLLTDVPPNRQVDRTLFRCTHLLNQILGTVPVLDAEGRMIPMNVHQSDWESLIDASLLGGQRVLYDWIVQQALNHGYQQPVTYWPTTGTSDRIWDVEIEDIDPVLLAHHVQDKGMDVVCRMVCDIRDNILTKDQLMMYTEEHWKIREDDMANDYYFEHPESEIKRIAMNVALKFKRLHILSWLLPMRYKSCIPIYPWLEWIPRS